MPSTTGSEFTFTQDVWPVCELGMSDTRQYEPTSWLDVSCYVHEAELFRGRERFNDRFQPGTCTITFTNENGWADISGSAAVGVPSAPLRPGRQIRIGVRGTFEGGTTVTTRWLWYGYIDQVVPDYDPTLHDVVTISAIDALGEAGQTVTPAGPMVGVNETVTARINRALDAIGWWPERRSIAASSTRVQGVTLGPPAIDVMSVAADSAGGVVYGSMGGDIVFKDLNWELYDNDIPPDGEIGNCDPGTEPIPGEPPYVDPTPGPVYDPCPPIPHPPECVDICIAPAEGTVIEQGDSWRIYVHDGHLWYESSGHLWDMGPWTEENDCTRICHPPDPTPPTPPSPPTPPTREDPGEPPIAGIPAPFQFTVEFLGYSDGGLLEGPQTVITVPGIAPGNDCLLIVAVNAICNDLVAGSLTPFPIAGGSITGGALVFDEIDVKEPAGFDGAEAYAAAVEIGREDPGTIDVVVDWSGEHASKYHIVTVWRVKGYRSDLMARMRLGAYLHAASWDRVGMPPAPPVYNPPGKGAAVLELETVDTIGTQIQPYTRLTDIVIAQSLAESPTEPFGAVFNVSDGVWWIPPVAVVPEEEPAALIPECSTTFEDDFEGRTTLAPCWFEASSPTVAAGWWTVQDGYVTNGGGYSASLGRYLVRDSEYHVAPLDGHALWIEVDIADGWPLRAAPDPEDPEDVHAYLNVRLYATSLTGTQTAGPLADFELENLTTLPGPVYDLDTFVIKGNCYYSSDHDGLGQMTYATYEGSAPAVVRLGLQVEGNTIRQFIDGVMVREHTTTATIPVRQRLAVRMTWDEASYPGVVEPKILAIRGSDHPIRQKCSWVAGFRPDPLVPLFGGAPNVKWDEVNIGPDDIQSTQLAIVMESGAAFGFTWKLLAYNIQAPTTDLDVPAGSHTSVVRPERLSMLIVFVAAYTEAEMADEITVTSPGLTFTNVLTRPTDSSGLGQGAVFTAKLDAFPNDPAAPPEVTVTWPVTVEKIQYAIYEVTNADTIGVTGAGVAGDHTPGSVTGGLIVPLSAPSADNSLVLGFLGASDLTANENGATSGVGWIEEAEVQSDQYAWFQIQSSDHTIVDEVEWMEMNGSTDGKDVVALCVEVLPSADFAQWSTYNPLMIGGARDTFGGPIYAASGSTGGETDWDFDPSEPH